MPDRSLKSHFQPADSPDASVLNGLALVLVVSLLWLADHGRRQRDRPTFVPREWVTEFHAASSNRAPQLLA